ncbi:MAG: AfsR/SARP family transcriptional regulator, partial [Rubrobacter sp.]
MSSTKKVLKTTCASEVQRITKRECSIAILVIIVTIGAAQVAEQRSKTRIRVGPKSITEEGRVTVRIRLLGGFSLSVDDRIVEHGGWRLRKAASLVKLLALAPGHRLHREQVMDLLWPNLGRRAASNNLRQALHAARKALHPAVGSHYLASEDESLVLCPAGSLWVDVDAFDDAANTASRAKEPPAYWTAIDLYPGELLPADRYEDWIEEHRRRLRETYIWLHLGLTRSYEERGDHESAAEVLRTVVGEDPLREEAHTDLMRLYALAGHQSDALAQYERLEEALREVEAEPAASSRVLRDEIASGRFTAERPKGWIKPAEEPAGVDKHNLPFSRTSFVGRTREIPEVKRELSMTRLLTLTGAGGCGKTRLALEVARE